MGNSKSVSKFRRNRKAQLISIKGGKCCVCGFDLFQEALEFHHKDPATKSFGIGAGNCHSQKEDISEVRKCAQVCSNCHAGIHAGYYNLPEDWDYIDEELVDKLLTDPVPTTYSCQSCGTEITAGSRWCVSCYIKAKQNAAKPSREDLKDLVRNNPFTQIGAKFCVSDNTIKKWCISYGLPSKKSEINIYSDEEWLDI